MVGRKMLNGVVVDRGPDGGLADVPKMLPLDYTSNMEWIYDNVPEWEGWEFPFPGTCHLCEDGNHYMCQLTSHTACRCWQLDHEPEEDWEEF